MNKLFDSRGKIAMFIIMLIASFLSFTFTLDMLISEATNTREKIIVLAMVLVLEAGKYYFVHKLLLWIGNFWVNLSFTVVLTVISLLCSGAYLVNKSNSSAQDAKQLSPRYIELTKSIKAKEDIRDDFLKWDRVTKADKVQDKIEELTILRDSIDVSITANTGRTALFLAISKLLSVKVNYIIISFNLLISLMTELLAIGFANEYLKNFRKKDSMNTLAKSMVKPKQTKEKPIVNITKIEAKPTKKATETIAEDKPIKKISDIDFSDKPFTKEEFSVYLKMMYKTEENGFAKGYKKICDFIKSEGNKIKITQVKGNDIRRFLEKIKAIELVGNRTKVVERIKV